MSGQAAMSLEQARQRIVEEGIGTVREVEADTFDSQILAIAASFGLQLGKQFDRGKFLAEVGRIRLRWLPAIVRDLTDAAGLYVQADFPIVAPADRHQLIVGVRLELFSFVAGIEVPVEHIDAQQLARLGVFDITRPQGDVVNEAVGDYLLPVGQIETDPNGTPPLGIYAENRAPLLREIAPFGLGQAFMYAFGALISPENRIEMALRNLAATGVTTNTGQQLVGALRILAVDCIKGGN